MNPQFHEEFESLCAIHHTGETTEEEWALLQVHMAYCEACKEKFLQYEEIASKVIPGLAEAAASEDETLPEESDASFDAAEYRLLASLSHSPGNLYPIERRSGGWSTTAYAAVGLVLIAGLAGSYLLGTKTKPHAPAVEQASVVPVEPPSPVKTTSVVGPSLSVKDSDRDQRLQDAQAQVVQASSALEQLKQKLAQRDLEQKQFDEKRTALEAQLVEAKQQLDAERARTVSSSAQQAQLENKIAALEAKVTTLGSVVEEKEVALSEKDRMLALDQDFLAHDKDIRDLIGARNLYIADISDTTETGKTAKQFGRIFYTQDRSLVFYGFDLEKQAGRHQNVSYQVWGSSSDHSGPVSLGLFFQDEAHKRWVLRSNDAKTLSRLDMVFVTVEPLGGSSKPTGKQFLRAYLQIQPNHP